MYDIDDLKNLVDMAAGGRSPADLLITNAKLVDVLTGEIRETDVSVGGGKILGFSHTEAVKVVDARGAYLLPGLIDAHIHIESSMVSPARFAGLVLPHGTTSVVADPHEIANVHGLEGIRYMLENGRHLPLNIFIALPSCVPATPFEDSGAVLSAEELEELIDDPKVTGIGEMMNFPGVVSGDYDVLAKIQLGTSHGKIVDGHAPGLLGRDLDAYLVTGITNTHECTTLEEMRENLRRGSYILIREGSAAKNLRTRAVAPRKPRDDCRDSFRNAPLGASLGPRRRDRFGRGLPLFGIGRLSRLHAASPPLSELGHSRLGPRGFDRRQLHLPAARLRVARIRDRTGRGQVLDESCRRGASLSLATPSRGARRRRRLRLRFARPNAFDPSVFRGARVFHWRRGNVALSFARQNEGTRLIWSPGT